jgi:hypothetical protein
VTAQPPVTAVIPTHERPEMMRRAVSSVLDQTYAGEVEVLVVFDACEPVLPDVEVPAGRTLRALVNDRRRGLAGGRNTGILAAAERPGGVPRRRRPLDAGEARPPGGGARPPTRRRPGGHGHGGRRRRPDPRAPGGDLGLSHRDLLHDRIASVHSSSFLVRRDALLGPLGLVDEEIPQSYGEDYDLLLRASALAPVAVVDEPLVSVTWQGDSLFVGRWETYAEAWQYLLAKHPGFGEHRRARAQMEAKIGLPSRQPAGAPTGPAGRPAPCGTTHGTSSRWSRWRWRPASRLRSASCGRPGASAAASDAYARWPAGSAGARES